MNFKTESQLRTELQQVWAMLESEREYRKWQPIETAPKDGTVVLLFDGEVFAGFYDNSFHDNFKWRVHIDGCHAGYPISWMPLPEPPAGA